MHDALSAAGGTLGLGTLPAVDPLQTLYANLMGSVVIVWTLVRLVRTLPVHGLFDGVARVLFACWQAYALTHGGPRLLLPFLAVEAMFGLAQLAPWAWPGRKALSSATAGVR